MTVGIGRLYVIGLDDSMKAEPMLARCVLLSQLIWEGRIAGERACLLGLISPTLLSEEAYVWLYTTPLADKRPFLLVRHSQRIVEELLKEFPCLVGHCSVKDKRAQRWLKWLGAEFSFPTGNLIPFVIRRK